MLNNIERMKYALTEWAIKEGVFDDATFYTQREWKERGEDFHNDAV